MKRHYIFPAAILLSLLTGCSSPTFKGQAIPSQYRQQEITIVRDKETRQGFIQVMEDWLKNNRYDYKVQEETSLVDPQVLTLTFEGKWGWDMTTFLANAFIDAQYQGKRVGRVHYYTPSWAVNSKKFAKAEDRIQMMMDALFGTLSFPEVNNRL